MPEAETATDPALRYKCPQCAAEPGNPCWHHAIGVRLPHRSRRKLAGDKYPTPSWGELGETPATTTGTVAPEAAPWCEDVHVAEEVI